MTQTLLEPPVGTENDTGDAPLSDVSPPQNNEAIAQRPDGIPEKFWDDLHGQVRTDALIKSYVELERKLGSAGTHDIPETPENYEINIQNDLIEIDKDLNNALHQAGFTQKQAQLVYDLASDKLMPLVSEIAAVFEADGQVARLVNHFGNEDRWRDASRQIRAWGKSHLPERVFEALSTTYEGVLAMQKMMAGDEPELARNGSTPEPLPTEADLKQLMRDPRYWRQQDPGFIRRVRDGFQRLYPDHE
jgi:Phage T7 capsid assembly protein